MSLDGGFFDRLGAEYGAARPPYPDVLWDALRDEGAIVPGGRALDLGAGTGQATGPLLDAGMRVTAVEPGARLAARLRERHPAARVITARAEDVVLPDGTFDLVAAATSLHWMDPVAVLPAVRRWLTPDGRFAAWWNRFGDADSPSPFRDAVARITVRRPPAPARPVDRDLAEWAVILTAGGAFRLERATELRWAVDLDEAQVRALFGTFSDWSPSEVAEAGDAVRALGGTVREHYRTTLLILSQVGDTVTP